MPERHEQATFTNMARYTVAVTVTVRGGAQPRTAARRAQRLAERLANAAARAADTVEVTAIAGPADSDGRLRSYQPVRFAAANTGPGTVGEPGKLARYLDPDHELALRSLEAANVAYDARVDADAQRRRAVDCRKPSRLSFGADRYCGCVYCEPRTHLAAAHDADACPEPLVERSCLCGQTSSRPGGQVRRARRRRGARAGRRPARAGRTGTAAGGLAVTKTAEAYVGRRDDGVASVTRRGLDGGARPLPHQIEHSPTGMEWGYRRSGPADLARSILADRIGWPPPPPIYQRFKFDVVARLPQDGFELPIAQVDAWLADRYPRRAQLSDRRADLSDRLDGLAQELHGLDREERGRAAFLRGWTAATRRDLDAVTAEQGRLDGRQGLTGRHRDQVREGLQR